MASLTAKWLQPQLMANYAKYVHANTELSVKCPRGKCLLNVTTVLEYVIDCVYQSKMFATMSINGQKLIYLDIFSPVGQRSSYMQLCN